MGRHARDLRTRETAGRYLLGMKQRGFLHTAHQLRGTDAVRSRESNNRPESWALYTPFNSAQLGSVYAEFDINIKLGQSRPLSNFTQHNSEGSLRA